PPPVEEMHPALDAFERFLHEPLTLPLLVWLALVHYQFEAIHPFRDGNGRLGRLLIILLLCERRWLPQPLLYLSAYFERHRQAYYDHLLAVSQRGAWREWVLFFLDAVTEQARDAVRRSQRLLSLQQHYRSRLQQERFPLASLHLVDALFSTPALTITQAARLLDVSFPAASQNIERLAAAGMLREVTGRPRNRVYLATEILRVLEEQLAPGEPEDDAIE
ncbi:MAG: Fic family protein, partial [Chloroflexi bacterium]|nr:Fic family protein [Chloroflexota bacterium]